MTWEAKRNAVIVVDDEPKILTTIEDLLEDEFSVWATTDAEAALRHLQLTDVAVVVSDQRMPRMGGDEFLGKAREISLATRVLVTGYADTEALARAVNHGQIYGYIAKPWDPAEFRAKIRQAADHYRLHLELAYERDLLHVLMDSIPDAIYFQDNYCRYTKLNKVMAGILGVGRPEDAFGRTLTEFCSEPWAQDTLDAERRIVETGLPVIDKLEQIRKADGRFGWFSTTKVPILGEGEQVSGIVVISRDITDRKETSEKLVQQAQQLERYNAELERFAYVAAHHLQEPLRTMASLTQILAQRYQGKFDSSADQQSEMLVAACVRMRQLVDDLLSHARVTRQPLKPAPTDCERVCQQALNELQAAIDESGARVTWDPLPTIFADELQLAQLFANLIGNAIKFRGEALPRVHVSVERKDGEWLFSVHDNGIGIDPQYCRQIFEIFQRLHLQSEYPGTGIGLALCQKIVESFHGRIWVESELGKGSKFFFTVPEEPAAASSQKRRS